MSLTKETAEKTKRHGPWVQLRRWLREKWFALLLIAFVLYSDAAEWAWLAGPPTALRELQYAGNSATAQRVMEAWSEVGITPDRIQEAALWDIPGLWFFAAFLALAAAALVNHICRGAKRWDRPVIGGAFLAAGCGSAGDFGIYAFLSAPHSDSLALRAVFICFTLKTFLFSAVCLYLAVVFGRLPWTLGFWDAARACGFSLFAAFVGPGLLAFGQQGTAIFEVINEDGQTYQARPTNAHLNWWAYNGPYWMALFATLFFSLMCWGAARYAVTYKEAERADSTAGTTEFHLGDRTQSFLRSLVSPLPQTQRTMQAAEVRQDSVRVAKNGQSWNQGWKAGELWIPRLCGLVPPLLIIWNIASADPGELPSKSIAWVMCGVELVIAVVLSIHAYFRTKSPEVAERLAAWDFYFYRATIFLGFGIVLAGCFGPQTLELLTVKTHFGPLTAWFLSFSLLVPFFTYLVTAGRRYGKPFLAVVLGYGFLINVADLNDDHGLRYKPYSPAPTALLPLRGSAGQAAGPMALNPAFDVWLASSPGAVKWRAAHPHKPYPVLFVAAAGGGIVAGGVLTATMDVLENTQRDAESHLFAISSVSGGSLGAVTYAALRDKGSLNKQNLGSGYSDAAKQVMTSDMLSPSVASLFGPEMIQRFLPAAVPDFLSRETGSGYKNAFALDRGRALEVAFQAALEEQTPPGAPVQAQAMLSAYPAPAGPRPLPALFLNTTCVETGQRMVISTLRPDPVPDDLSRLSSSALSGGDWPLPFETLFDVNPRIDLPLTAAACLSARFPVVSPPAFVPQWRDQPIQGAAAGTLFPLTVKRRYVDGGYYENTGVETAMDVIDALRRQDKPHRPQWRPVLISLHMNDSDTSRQFARGDLSGKELDRLGQTDPNSRRSVGFDEVLGPAEAFFNGWGGPPRPQLMRARRRLQGTDGQSDFIELSFPYPAILGWYLSKNQYSQLQCQAVRMLCPQPKQAYWLEAYHPAAADEMRHGDAHQGTRLRAILDGK